LCGMDLCGNREEFSAHQAFDRSPSFHGHVIGGDMDERHPPRSRPAGNKPRALAVDDECEIALVLGLIDGRVGKQEQAV
jgi:hypothetical protein